MMSGVEKITARIEAEAAADAARTARETEAQCAAIRAEGEKQARERYERRVSEGVKSAEDRVQRLSKAADMEARKSVLACKQRIVADAFDRAEQKLRALRGDEYAAFLAGLAARAAVSGGEEIVLSAADGALGAQVLALANETLAKAGRPARLTLAPDAGDFDGGLVLRDGDISVNCTIAALMAQARQDMAAQVAAKLLS